MTSGGNSPRGFPGSLVLLREKITRGTAVETTLASDQDRIYTCLRVLGEGTGSFIVEVRHQEHYYAAKIGMLHYESDLENMISTYYQDEKEIYTLLPKESHHFVCLYDTIELMEDNIGILILEPMDGTLLDLPLGHDEVIPCIKAILEALVFLHDLNITHGDLYSGSIFRKRAMFKIGDFGESYSRSDDIAKRRDVRQTGQLFAEVIYHKDPSIFSYRFDQQVLDNPYLPIEATRQLLRGMIGPSEQADSSWSAREALSFLETNFPLDPKIFGTFTQEKVSKEENP